MTIKVLGYGRVSTALQEISPEVQEKHCRDWYATQCERDEWDGDSGFIGMLMDKAVSGKVDLFKRPQGQRILETLGRGDVLVVSKLSRAFRSTQDALRSVDALRDVGIRLVLLDIQIDTGIPTGRLMLTMLAAVAQFERELIGERTRDAMRHRRREGQWVGVAPPGWLLRTKKDTGRRNNDLIPDYYTRMLGRIAADMIRNGTSVELVAQEVNRVSRKSESSRKPTNKAKPFSDKLMTTWATYCLLGWPPLSRVQVTEKFSPDAFTNEWVRQFNDVVALTRDCVES